MGGGSHPKVRVLHKKNHSSLGLYGLLSPAHPQHVDRLRQSERFHFCLVARQLFCLGSFYPCQRACLAHRSADNHFRLTYDVAYLPQQIYSLRSPRQGIYTPIR